MSKAFNAALAILLAATAAAPVGFAEIAPADLGSDAMAISPQSPNRKVEDRWPSRPLREKSRTPPEPPRWPIPRVAKTLPPVQAQEHGCDFEGLVAKSGEDFVAHVRTMAWDCVSALFSRAPIEIRLAAFAEENMVVVAGAARRLAIAFDGTGDGQGLGPLLVYLRAGLRGEPYELAQLQWSPAVHAAVTAALDSLVANPRLQDETGSAGLVLENAFPLMDGPPWRLDYLSVVVDWLSRWGPVRAADRGQRQAALGALRLMFNCQAHAGFEAVVAELPAVVTTLGNLALGDWMVGTDAEDLAASGARVLAVLLGYPNLPFYEEVRQGVQQVLDRYDPLGESARLWTGAAGVVVYYGECEAFGICEQLADLQNAVLSVNHSCNPSVRIRGQGLSVRQLTAACASLRRQEAIFHWRLMTNRQPVADDLTAVHEIVAFADYDNYHTYSGLFFGNPTDNGGIFYEGDPSQPGNVARHLGYVATWLPNEPIWNLEHEYVHHLDSRFNLYGDIGESRIDTHKTLWWIEGLAEYLSRRDDNERAIALARASPLALQEVFTATYASGVDRVYRWPYLAVRFLFERHPAAVAEVVGHLRTGDYDGYLNFVNAGLGLGAAQNTEWQDWLGEVESIEYHDVATISLDVPPEVSIVEGGIVVDFARVHPGRTLMVRAVSSNPEVVAVAVQNGRLTVTAASVGEAIIHITVSDAWNTAARQFTVAAIECPTWLCRSFTSGWRQALLVPGNER